MKKNVKIKNTLFIGGLTSLAFLACLTVGYASWNFGNLTNGEANVDVSIGKVHNYNFFIIDGIDMFYLGPDGMVKDDTIVETSTITAFFHIDNQSAYNFYKTNSFSFEIALYCEDADFLSNYIALPNLDTSISEVSLDNSTAKPVINNELVSKVTVSNLPQSGEKTIIIKYTVTDTFVDKKSSIANNYYTNKPKFTFKIRGIENE